VSASRLPQANASHCEAMLHAGFILLFTLVCNAKQHNHLLTHEVSASCLPKANASHCEAMLHAGFILLFTLVCIRKPTQKPLRCRGKTINLSCPYSRKRALHVCRRQTLHIAKQCFTQDLSCSSRWFAYANQHKSHSVVTA